MSSFKKFQELERFPHHSNCDISDYLPKSFKPNQAYIVAWYGRIVSIGNDIKVRVFFVKNNQEFYTCALIPIAIIPQVPIGSIWINGRSKSKLIKGNLPLVSFRDLSDENSYENTVVYDNIDNKESTVFAALKSNYHINIIEDKGAGTSTCTLGLVIND